MATEWRLDPENPYEDGFEESLLRLAEFPAVYTLVTWKLIEIQEDPKANDRAVVNSGTAYYTFTGPVSLPEGDIEPLVVAYTLDESAKLIQRVFVRKAAEFLDDPRGGAIKRMVSALERAIERALANARKKRRH